MQVPLQSCFQWCKISRICLHNLVRLAAEVLGAKAEQKVGRRRGQKRTKCLEPAADKGLILQLCLVEAGNSHLSKSLESM